MKKKKEKIKKTKGKKNENKKSESLPFDFENGQKIEFSFDKTENTEQSIEKWESNYQPKDNIVQNIELSTEPVKTGEENDKIIFKCRVKLFQLNEDWKERFFKILLKGVLEKFKSIKWVMMDIELL
jgi:hypothetical protein